METSWIKTERWSINYTLTHICRDTTHIHWCTHRHTQMHTLCTCTKHTNVHMHACTYTKQSKGKESLHTLLHSHWDTPVLLKWYESADVGKTSWGRTSILQEASGDISQLKVCCMCMHVYTHKKQSLQTIMPTQMIAQPVYYSGT